MRHRPLWARVRPIGAPDQILRIGGNKCVVEWSCFCIIWRHSAQPVSAGQFRPQPAFADAAQQSLKAGMAGTVTVLHAAHMIDDHWHMHVRECG